LSVDTLPLVSVSLNQMKRSILLLVVLAFLSCKHGQYKFNPEAKRLNDSAVKLMLRSEIGTKYDPEYMAYLRASLKSKDTTEDWSMEPGNDDNLSLRQLDLFNKAIKIDSNYLMAYSNKFGIECHLKRYKDALITAREIARIFPEDIYSKFLLGKMYDINGDSVRARGYYKDFLLKCNQELDTMAIKSQQREFAELQKGLVLVLLGQPDKGDEIIKGLYQKANSRTKNEYLLYMRLKRADILMAKDTSITIDNATTMINTLKP
jgi:tetratricopeptide (TPR) repeat protein